jgi:hypothetical protein
MRGPKRGPVVPIGREKVAAALYEAWRTKGDTPAWGGLLADELREPWLAWADTAIGAMTIPKFSVEEITVMARNYGGDLQTASFDGKAMEYLSGRINAEIWKVLT